MKDKCKTLEWNYLIYKDIETGNTCAINGFDREINYIGKNPINVINKVLGNLTKGRTWKEKVVLKGNLILTNPINIMSYTTLEINGIISSPDTTIDSLIFGKNISDIIISGGELCYSPLSYNTNAEKGVGIRISQGVNVTIKNVYIHDTSASGIYIGTGQSNDIIIKDSIIKNVGFEGIQAYSYGSQSNRISISGNYIDGIYKNKSFNNTCPGIGIAGYKDISIKDNYVNNSTAEAAIELLTTRDSDKNQNAIISNNHLLNGNKGIAINRWGGILISDTIIISDNIITDCQDGIRIGYSNDIDAFQNIIITNNNIDMTRYGIYTNPDISTSNRIYNLNIGHNILNSAMTGSIGIYIQRTNKCSITNNIIKTITDDIYIDANSTNILIADNQFATLHSNQPVSNLYIYDNVGYI